MVYKRIIKEDKIIISYLEIIEVLQFYFDFDHLVYTISNNCAI